MIPEPFASIVNKRYAEIFKKKDQISDEKLKFYFDTCFEDICSHHGLYACWICVSCMKKNILSYGWGEKPDTCPKCDESSTYSIATFQSWASKTGDVFEWAFYKLIKEISDLQIKSMRRGNRTHDFEITDKIAIEAKGSAEYIKNPDGSKYDLAIPGMKRSDTEKKAFSNGEKYKSLHPNNKFYIITNAVPEGLTVAGRAVDGLFNVTKKRELETFIEECKKYRGAKIDSLF